MKLTSFPLALLLVVASSAAVTGQSTNGLSVSLSSGSYAAGQTMIVTATLSPIVTRQVDAYMVMQTPDGQFRSLQIDGSFVAGIQPIARRIVPFTYQAVVGNYRFTSVDPIGTYTWYAALTEPGTVSIVGTLMQTTFTVIPSVPVAPAGGTVTLPNVASITFPSGAFASTTSVSVQTTTAQDTATTFTETAAILRPQSRLSYEIRVNTGATPPASNDVTLDLTVPDAFLSAVPANYQIDVFAQVYQDGGSETLDTFQSYPGTLNRTTKTVRVTLPTQVFTNKRTADASWEAILTLATTPGPGNALVASTDAIHMRLAALAIEDFEQAGTCLASNIDCPLGGGNCSSLISSEFQPAGRTVNGTTRPHFGTDFRVSAGTRINAVADGTVERSYLSETYGNTVVIRHTDGGATLYAHLSTRSVSVGQSVTRGTQIGLSGGVPGTTGAGTSTGAHLHFEYVPNGQIIQSRNRIDPAACIGTTLTGSITVRDNGTLADDAFEVFLDNIRLGATTIGGTNNFAVNNLISGNHTLRVVCTIAPDNVGTLGVTLSQGLTFSTASGGGTSRSTSLTQGGSVTYTIVVP